MRRRTRSLAYLFAICLALLLYREWVVRSRPPLFLPLGFFESAIGVKAMEEGIRDPRAWEDPVSSLVTDDTGFERLARDAGATERTAGVLVEGATLGGMAAALAAAEEGVPTVLFAHDDWKQELVAAAERFVTQTGLPEAPGSAIERALRRWVASPETEGQVPLANGTPASVSAFFEKRVAAAPALELLSRHVPIAFAKNAEGRLDRVLLRGGENDKAVVVRFEYFLDGTLDGSGFARAGIPTHASMDGPAIADPGSIPPAAAAAIAEGYTLSGRTILGVGKRLENATLHMGVLDRGFHGTFAAPDGAAGCWDRVIQSPVMKGQTVWKAKAIGCTARMTVESTAEDTVELFVINHGNDAVSATVRLGETTMRVERRTDPSETFVRLGAFPAGHGSPIIVDVASTLPTDKLEGIVARKLNTASMGIRALAVEGGARASFTVNDWRNGTYDAYVTTESAVGVSTIMIDERLVPAERIGNGTYLARGVSLSAGEHAVRVPDGDGPLRVTIIPVAPAGGTPLAGKPGDGPTWTFTPDRDGEFLVTIPAFACAGSCTYTIQEEGKNEDYVLRAHADKGTELVAQIRPLGMVRMQAGVRYELLAQGDDAGAFAPSVSPAEADSALYAIGNNAVGVAPPREGMLYDVWVRSLRSSRATVRAGTFATDVELDGEWRYAATEPLPQEGLTATAGGKIEILAIPNATLDTFHLPLHPAEGALDVDDVPPGGYAIASFGAENPGSLRVTTADGTVQTISFEGREGAFRSEQTYYGGAPSSFSLSLPWPQRMVLYERIAAPADARVPIDGARMVTIDDKVVPGMAAGARGTLLFTARPEGIGPIALGTAGSRSTEERARRSVEDAFLLLRMGKTNVRPGDEACPVDEDPRCDPRRFVRAASAFGTVDGLPLSATYPEGRRIAGMDTLTASGAYAPHQGCVTCYDECLAGTLNGASCVLPRSLHAPAKTVLSVLGASGATFVMSPLERDSQTLSLFLAALRRDKILDARPTYLEGTPPRRDMSLTLGMLVPEGYPNVLAASTTASATPGAAKALRLPTTELAIGNAAGYVAAFSLRAEHAPLWFIMDSPDAFARLQRYLVDRGVRVQAVTDDDPLVAKAKQALALDGRATLVPAWTGDAVTYALRYAPDELSGVFGDEDVRTVRDALERLPGSPVEKNAGALFRFGIANGFLNDKILTFNLEEIMALPLDESYLLKADYLLRRP